MAIEMLSTASPDRNLESRRKLVRLEVYRRAGRIGRTPTRAYVVAYAAWRMGDVPFEPDPADVGLTENVAAAWRLTVDMWVEEVSGDE